jgi:hypothetical protein
VTLTTCEPSVTGIVLLFGVLSCWGVVSLHSDWSPGGGRYGSTYHSLTSLSWRCVGGLSRLFSLSPPVPEALGASLASPRCSESIFRSAFRGNQKVHHHDDFYPEPEESSPRQHIPPKRRLSIGRHTPGGNSSQMMTATGEVGIASGVCRRVSDAVYSG